MASVTLLTNINLAGDRAAILSSDIIKVVANLVHKSQHEVMVLAKGSLPITFDLSKDPAAYVDIISIGAITKEEKKNLIVHLGTLLQTKYDIPKTRFICAVFDTTVWSSASKL